MRSIGTAALLVALTNLAACGSDGSGVDGDAVPTITTRPSASSSAPASTAPASTSAAPATSETSSEPTTATPTETAGPSPEPPTDEPVGPTTYRQASAQIRDSGPPIAQPVPRFSVDDDLIYCLLDDPVIGPACELSRGFIDDDEVCGGAAEGVGRIETFEGEARPVCNSDTIREPGAEDVLGDGVVSNGGDVRCLVDRRGVTCIDEGDRTGFFLAPREYHVF